MMMGEEMGDENLLLHTGIAARQRLSGSRAKFPAENCLDVFVNSYIKSGRDNCRHFTAVGDYWVIIISNPAVFNRVI
jgi:hypothetical protein